MHIECTNILQLKYSKKLLELTRIKIYSTCAYELILIFEWNEFYSNLLDKTSRKT